MLFQTEVFKSPQYSQRARKIYRMKSTNALFNCILSRPSTSWLVALVLVVATVLVYAPVRHHEFIDFDDGGYVYENEIVQKGLSADSIKWAFTLVNSDEKTYWHPVAWLSHMLDCQLFGLNPGAHHLSNLFYHLLNIMLLYLVLFRMTGAVWKSAFVAAMFAIHPVNVDSVAWIAERKNLLSTTFWMLTMLAYVYYAARPGLWRYLMMTVVFTLGLMAKPMLVTLPCALLLLDFWPLYRCKWSRERWLDEVALPPSDFPAFHTASISRLILEKIPLLALSFTAMALSFISLEKNSQILNEIVQPMGLRIANALVSYAHYLWKMVWPANLAVFYPFPTEIPLWQPMAAGVALITATGLVIAYSRKKPYLATGWFWYVGTLTPVIGIIQGGLWPQIAERWAYVPFVGVFILLAWGVPDLAGRLRWNQRIVAILGLAVIGLFATLTTGQLKHWKNSKTLFQHTLNVTESNFMAHLHVGHFFFDQDDTAKAIENYRQAIEIMPNFNNAYEALGDTYVSLKDDEKAFFYYHKALLNSPSSVGVFYKIGNLYAQMGRYDQAVRYFKDIIAFSPDDPTGHNNLGAAYLYMGDSTAALQNLKKAIALQPDYPEAFYNLGLVASKIGDIGQAMAHFQKAVALNPDYGNAHSSLGKIFFQSGNMDQAMVHFRQAARITPDNATTHYNIGVILYMRGQMTEAARFFQNALEIDPGYDKAMTALKLVRP